jgi:hypothetical protein
MLRKGQCTQELWCPGCYQPSSDVIAPMSGLKRVFSILYGLF